MRDSVKKFANDMEAKLQEHDAEDGVAGWLDNGANVDYLLDELESKLKLMKNAFKDCSSHDVMKQSVHIGNYAMMINNRLESALMIAGST